MSDYILFTGATGLLGRYLLRDLLNSGRHLAVVVRSTEKTPCEDRIESILQSWETLTGELLPRPVVLEGNICEPFLGLSDEDQTWVASNCTSVLHNAASLTFNQDSSGEPRRSNVEGTRHTLDLCEQAGIREVHYVSTAYVAGLRQGVIKEDELDEGQTFRNDYERSKLEAEKMVREARFIEDLTVYRPVVIAGDSQTGFTTTYHGIYLYLKLMSVLAHNTEPGPDGVRYTPVRINRDGDEPRNLVPVDWTSAVIAHLVNTPDAHGKTFHMAPEKPFTARDMVDAGHEYFNSYGVEFVGSGGQFGEPRNDLERNAYDNTVIYREYELSDPIFDRTNLMKYAGHLPCPAIDKSMLQKFWKYGEEDKWGRRRVKATPVPPSIKRHLLGLVTSNGAEVHGEVYTVNMNVVGPGGVAWTAKIQGGKLVDLDRGISPDADATWRTDAATFWSLSSNGVHAHVDALREGLICETESQRIAEALCAALFRVPIGLGPSQVPLAQES